MTDDAVSDRSPGGLRPVPYPPVPSSEAAADLPKVPARRHGLDGLAYLLELEALLVDRRLGLVDLHGARHGLEQLAASHGDALEADVLGHHRAEAELGRRARQHADQRQRAARAHRADGGVEGARDLDHEVDPHAACHLAGDLVPVGVRLVVDDVIRAHRADALELGVARRGREDAGAVHLREQEGEERHAARPLDEHDVPRLDPALRDDGVPRGDRSAGQGRRLDRVQMARSPDHPLLAQRHVLLHDAIPRTPERAAPVGLVERPAEPSLAEDRADEVAHRRARDPGADRYHASCAVGDRDQGKLAAAPPVAAARHDVVPVVERGGSIRTSTSPGPASGTGRSASSMLSGLQVPWISITLMPGILALLWWLALTAFSLAHLGVPGAELTGRHASRASSSLQTRWTDGDRPRRRAASGALRTSSARHRGPRARFQAPPGRPRATAHSDRRGPGGARHRSASAMGWRRPRRPCATYGGRVAPRAGPACSRRRSIADALARSSTRPPGGDGRGTELLAWSSCPPRGAGVRDRDAQPVPGGQAVLSPLARRCCHPGPDGRVRTRALRRFRTTRMFCRSCRARKGGSPRNPVRSPTL